MAVRQRYDGWRQSLKPSADSQAHISSPRRRRYDETKYDSIADWNFSLWFVLLSPVIGILSGILGVFLVHH
jgi:hypothetical protein